MRLLGQLRAVWDLAGQIVDLRTALNVVEASIEEMGAAIDKIEERTRKQDYRARKAEQHEFFAPTLRIPDPNASPEIRDKSQLRAVAKQRGIIE